MAETSVTERRIKPIHDAARAENWKQALKECEKWQKKGEKSDRFLTLKANILLRQQDEKSRQKGREETLALCRRAPAVSDITSIYQLQESLKVLSLYDEEAPKLWERAVQAQPTDKELLMIWFEDCTNADDWKSAQKATTALRKAFPRERKYELWNIVMCFLIHEDTNVPEKDRKLFGTLANRMITKIAEARPIDKSFGSVEEVALLGDILLKTGPSEPLLKILESADHKELYDQDPLTLQTMKEKAWEADPEWPRGPSNVKELLTATEPLIDDDRLWNLVVTLPNRAETVSDASTQRQTYIDIFEALLEKNPTHRQCHLARIDMYLGLQAVESQDDQNTSLQRRIIDMCSEYLTQFGDRLSCFDDLVPRFKKLPPPILNEFAVEHAGAQEPSVALFMLKLNYHLAVSKAGLEQVLDLGLAMYTSDAGKPNHQAEAALIAAMTVLRMATLAPSPNLLLQASVILRASVNKYPDYYPLRVLLLQVQTCLGLFPSAMESFIGLSIKNLQYETIGYLLLTRIATLHPHQHGFGKDSLNPLSALDTALAVAENAQSSLNKAIQQGLKHGSYSNVIDTVKVRSNLQNSLVRRLYVLEERKCKRALSIPQPPSYFSDKQMVDQRDYSFMPTYGIDNPNLTDVLSCGPLPQKPWVESQQLNENILAACTAIYHGDDSLTQNMLSAIESSLQRISTLSGSITDLTFPEMAQLENSALLATLILSLIGRKQVDWEGSSPTNHLDVIENYILATDPAEKQEINGVQTPGWKYLHACHVRLQTLATILTAMTTLQTAAKRTGKAAGKKTKEKDNGKDMLVDIEVSKRIENLVAAVPEAVAVLKRDVVTVRNGLREPGVLAKLVGACQGLTATEIGGADGEGDSDNVCNGDNRGLKGIELMTETDLEDYCGKMREDWESGLDGVLSVEVPTLTYG